MNTGLWIWPVDTKSRGKVLREVGASPQLLNAMTLLMKSKEGLSNSELDDMTADNSNCFTLWILRQLTSLGFIEFRVDLFGGPAKYRLTDLGKTSLGTITGQPAQLQPQVKTPPAAPTQAQSG